MMIVHIITAFLVSLSTTSAQSRKIKIIIAMQLSNVSKFFFAVILFPDEWIVLPGASGAFTCSSRCCHRDINNIQWILNGTVLEVYGSIPFLESFDPDLEIGSFVLPTYRAYITRQGFSVVYVAQRVINCHYPTVQSY